MGNSHPNRQRSRRTSSSLGADRRSTEPSEITRKISEKECVFIAMESEINKVITENNRETMKSLAAEIAAHIMDLNQLKKIQLTSTDRGRTERVIYNFELSLAKLKSIFNYDTAMKKERDRDSNLSNSSSFHNKPVGPDIVNDLIRFNNTEDSLCGSSDQQNTLSNITESESTPNYHHLSRSNSLYSNEPQILEEAFGTIESEFDVLKDQAQRPVQDVSEYYQMDKGVFYLYVKLKNIELPENSELKDRKLKLIKELADFRTSLDKMSGELEEQNEIAREITTVELLLESASGNEVSRLKSKALELQKSVDKISWQPYRIENKLQLLGRLSRLLEITGSPNSALQSCDEHIYGNLISPSQESDILEAQQKNKVIYTNTETNDKPELTIMTDNSNIENSESLYSNVNIIRQNKVSKLPKRRGSNVSQRGTIYSNIDIVKQNSTEGNYISPGENTKLTRKSFTKRPMPIPRSYDDKVIKELPKHWNRLNQIFDQDSLSDIDKSELAYIEHDAEVARNLFERKIRNINEKFEASVEL